MALRVGRVHASIASIGLLLFGITSFSQSSNKIITGEPASGSSFNSKPNGAVRIDQPPANNVWEDAVYNDAVKLDAKGQYAEAASTYKRACDGFARACTNLGFMYNKGQGVKMDHLIAAEFYKLGCDRGNPLGCTNLGIMYWKNDLPKNDGLAAEFFERGCRNGDGGGCRNLAYLYDQGEGVPQDEARAAELDKQADQLSHVHHIPFHLQDGMVLISPVVNGESALLIVDTGSERTTLDRKLLPPSWIFNQPAQIVSTLTSDGQAYPLTLKWSLDGREIQLPALVGNFDFPEGAVGLFGADILETFSSVRFNYLDMDLILEEQ